MVGTHSGYRAPGSQDDAASDRRSEISIKSPIPYVKSSEQPGLRWPTRRSELAVRYKVPILLAIFSTIALALLIGYSAGRADVSSPELELGEPIDGRLGRAAGGSEVAGARFYGRWREAETPEIRVIRRREAPETGASQLRRVETGSKDPRGSEPVPGNVGLFEASDSPARTNVKKRGVESREKLGACERSAEECKAVLRAMRSLEKTVGNNVESLNKLMGRGSKENWENKDASKFGKLVQCLECRKLASGDPIKFVDDSEADEAAIYNHPVFQNRRSQMTKALTLAEMLDDPKPPASAVGKRMAGGTSPGEDGHEYPTSWLEPNVNDPKVKKTVGIATIQNKTADMEVTYIIKNTTIVKHLAKAESREELSRPENVRTEMPTAPSLLFNTPGREENFGWGEVTRSRATSEGASTTTATTPVPRRNVQSGARVAAGPRRPSVKGHSEGGSVLFPTAETSRAGQQVQFTPPVSWTPYPVCFFGPPNPNGLTGSAFRQPTSFAASSPGAFPFAFNHFPQRGFSFAGAPAAPGFPPMHHPPQFPFGNPAAGFQQAPYVGPTAPGGQGFFQSFGNGATGPGAPGRAPYYCTFMSAPTYQLPSQPGVAEFQRNEDYPSAMVTGRENSLDLEREPQEANFADLDCRKDERRCRDGSRCVPRESWCNVKVDCPDASDESRCSCRARVNKDRICDGYFDCPRGEDELGCFGCAINSFSCKDWSEPEGVGEECVPLTQRCDGSKQCPNGKDEEDCSMLAASFTENQNLNIVGYTVGYLHRNWQGRWYPVCTATESWAVDACTAETGFPLRDRPRSEIESISLAQYSGPYTVELGKDNVMIVPHCHKQAVFVKCPQVPCGTRVLSRQELRSSFALNEDSFLGIAQSSTSPSNSSNVIDQILGSIRNASITDPNNATGSEIVGAESRVVGGKASHPKAWPFLVAIYKDGFFRCGGIIVNENWIITAAHCVEGFASHYYEVQAGVLRRSSFSPTVQTRRADFIVMYPYYDGITMKNDLGLMKLDEPLRFNRWIRPACLPTMWPTDSSLGKEPLFDTTCVTAGWGTMFEQGPNPDHLREVELPIARHCKHPEDRNEAEICAGLPQGGRDACQGDSGGPLMCNFPHSENQWYVAGIVSHGEGCAHPNEPGAYTKVGHFVDWINSIIGNEESTINGPKPLASCPGFPCSGGLGKCLPARNRCDGVADCLGAEDEVNCASSWLTGERNASRIHWDSSRGSEFLGQSNPAARDEIIFHINPPAFANAANWMDASRTKLPEVNSGSTPTMATTTETTSEATTTADPSTTEPTTTTSLNPRQFPANYAEQPHFTCTRIMQSLTIDRRCNRIIDCEDGTDEDNCTCKDYLTNFNPKSICNGHVDCDDGSDEENCGFCRANEFTCSRSGTCIPEWKLCDQKVDCDNMEDELDCFSLTNGEELIVDFDRRPQLNLEGVVTKWENRTWRPLCVHVDTDLLKLSNKFCEYFGFGSAEYSEKMTVRGSPIKVKESSKDSLYPYEYPPSLKPPGRNVRTCNGVYVRCKPILSANTNHLVVTNPLNTNIDYLWPWQASIFADGRFRCPGTLLDRSWLLVTSRCIENLDLGRNYTMAVVGTAPPHLYVNGPFQQISPIDSIIPVKKLDSALLHLQTRVNHTRYVQPIFVQKRIFPPTDKDDCVAVGVDRKYQTNTTFLRPVLESCPFCYRCYKNATLEDCANNGTLSSWSGTIACRGSGSWYPAATFKDEDVFCGFQSTRVVTSIDYGNALLTEIMEGNFETVGAPSCDGFRCPFGSCLPWDRVCNGVDDCRDRSDENPDYCRKRKDECRSTGGPHCKCSKSELTCANGQCVAKESFCDLKNDCEDGSDETAHCTCAEYLKLTMPDRLCNNVRDCLDKSDESNEECKCEGNRFKCTATLNATRICISRDFVCDGELDCPNGDDEKICRGIQGSSTDPRGTGQVLRRSFGVWHSECFPMPVTSTKEVSDICRTMNYNSGEALRLENPDLVYGQAMIPDRDEFYMIRLNERAWISLKKNRPLVKLVVPNKTCNRAFVKCV
ncbi:serine protease nudel [Venturia canescens]|uniref:serine protease nudel n=1 Tax=Venturia canescens TaxID=32260 RepID=UPI001C9BBF68|nr:serine protease nudel [Venturia canescens]